MSDAVSNHSDRTILREEVGHKSDWLVTLAVSVSRVVTKFFIWICCGYTFLANWSAGFFPKSLVHHLNKVLTTESNPHSSYCNLIRSLHAKHFPPPSERTLTPSELSNASHYTTETLVPLPQDEELKQHLREVRGQPLEQDLIIRCRPADTLLIDLCKKVQPTLFKRPYKDEKNGLGAKIIQAMAKTEHLDLNGCIEGWDLPLLHYFCREGNLDAVHILIEMACSPHMEYEGKTPIQYAQEATKNSQEIIRVLKAAKKA